MNMMKMIRCFKTTARSSRNAKSESSQSAFNEYYRSLLQQFANHCQTSNQDVNDPDWLVYQRNEQNVELLLSKKNNYEDPRNSQIIPGVPHVDSSDIFEIESVPGTENRYLELISAEWGNTKVSLKRHTFKGCQDAIKADVAILNEIRHPNVLLLMATTHTDEHGLVSVFEPVNCTLYNYIHVQGERINLHYTMQIGLKVADVLRYCHMRGYIHSAISSHCVYFAPGAMVKLGGWELARKAESVYVERDYEKYLRVEIDKWQAPEMSYGRLYSTKKSDVYCLMLLLWEMCTACIPYDGSDRLEPMESEYAMRNRSLSLRNIPSLLRNLLETGLQIDETKRTLDMDKIRRELLRLLVIHEHEKNSANECENNNNDTLSYDISNIKCSSPVLSSMNTKVNTKTFAEQHSRSPVNAKSKESIHQFCTPDKEEHDSRDSTLKNATRRASTPAISDNIITSPVTEADIANTSCTNCAEILNMAQEIDEESNARADIKRLKQSLADQRERFFLGINSTSSPESNTKVMSDTTRSLKKSTSFDYIICKPASHTTTMEPRFNKSLNEYDGNTLKSSSTLQRKAPYMSMPASIKDAIMQRRVLHPDAQSFYESTLWKKEKEICLSRMGRDSKDDDKISPLQRPINNGLSTIGEDKAQYHESVRTRIDRSCAIKTMAEGNNFEDTEESMSQNVKNTCAMLPTVADKSIQDLQNALERATEIIRSRTPTRDNDLSERDETQEYGSAFEEALYDSQEIPHGGRLASDHRSFAYVNRTHASTKSIEAGREHGKNLQNRIYIPGSMSDEKLNSLAIALTNRCRKVARNNAIVNEQSTARSQEIDGNNKTAVANGTTPTIRQLAATGADFEPSEERYVNVPIALNANTPTISSRRSILLQARLNPTKTDCRRKVVASSPLKSDRQGKSRCTTEDLYIDDELEVSDLNYNLILLGDDYDYLLDSASADDESLRTTEL